MKSEFTLSWCTETDCAIGWFGVWNTFYPYGNTGEKGEEEEERKKERKKTGDTLRVGTASYVEESVITCSP